MRVWIRDDHTTLRFLKRTVAAQAHFLAAIASVVATVVLLHLTEAKPNTEHFFACLAFGVTAFMVFATSATYHFLHDGLHISSRLEHKFENLDHFTIYLFIAGTYTPLVLNVLSPPWKMILLLMIWSIALIGILYTLFRPRLPLWAQHRYVYTGLFLLMGWTFFVRAGEIWDHLTSYQMILFLAGALSYTFGAIGYATKRPKLFPGVFGYHELWHVSVVLGAAFHYFLILDFYR